MQLLKLLISGFLVFVAALANARTISLNFYDNLYQGSGILYLKATLKQQYPYENPQNLRLNYVVLVAKSKFGRGQAALVVGGTSSYSQTVYGNEYYFDDPAEWTFYNSWFSNPSYDSAGVWQVHMQGNIKVRRVILDVTDVYAPSPNPGPIPPTPKPTPTPVPSPNPGSVVVLKAPSSYYPDHNTANGLCIFNGYRRAVGFTQWKQAGNIIGGFRSYDGSANFSSFTWGGGMAIDQISCTNDWGPAPTPIPTPAPTPRPVPTPGGVVVLKAPHSYYPDHNTANGLCIFNGYRRAVGFTQWKQAGNIIGGFRSYDGSANFSSFTWGGGMAIDQISCTHY